MLTLWLNLEFRDDIRLYVIGFLISLNDRLLFEDCYLKIQIIDVHYKHIYFKFLKHSLYKSPPHIITVDRLAPLTPCVSRTVEKGRQDLTAMSASQDTTPRLSPLSPAHPVLVLITGSSSISSLCQVHSHWVLQFKNLLVEKFKIVTSNSVMF